VESSPNDKDLGEQEILKRQESYQPFTVSASVPLFYTSNVALTPRNVQDDVIFAPSVGFSYVPRISSTLYATFFVGQQQFYYGDFNELDFGSFDARAGLTYLVPQWHDLSLSAVYAYNRLTSDTSFDDEFFSSHGIILSAEVPFRIGRAQQISVGADANLNIHAEPSLPGRNDFDGYVAYSVNLTRAFSLNAVGRLSVRDYTDDRRTDVAETVSLGVTYRFNPWFSAIATTTYSHSDSNRDVFDYDVFNGGGALTFAYRF
jgi:predicted porin